MKLFFWIVLAVTLITFSTGANADIQRGIRNYQEIIDGKKTVEQLSDEEIQEVLVIHNAVENNSADGGNSAGGGKGSIESRIDGTFEGWSGETIFKLINGQIWQQSSYAYTYHYAYRPEVLIYSSGGGYKMKVEGVNGSIAVRKLR